MYSNFIDQLIGVQGARLRLGVAGQVRPTGACAEKVGAGAGKAHRTPRESRRLRR